MSVIFNSDDDAFLLLDSMDAPKRLIEHAKVVNNVARHIALSIKQFGIEVDFNNIMAGAVLHDVGKIEHPEELSQSGHQHEEAGQQMLLELDVSENIAIHCITHAQWNKATTLEQLVVALADKLWKGKRVRELETKVIEFIANMENKDFWDVYAILEPQFEKIADDGHSRLLK